MSKKPSCNLEDGGSVDVTHNVCCCISPEAVAAGKREAYKQGAKDALSRLLRYQEWVRPLETMPQIRFKAVDVVCFRDLKGEITGGDIGDCFAIFHCDEPTRSILVRDFRRAAAALEGEGE